MNTNTIFNDDFVHTMQYLGEETDLTINEITKITGGGNFTGRRYQGINLNKIENRTLLTLNETETAIDNLKLSLPLEKLERFDFCLNSIIDFEDPHFYKLNKYLLSLYAEHIGAKKHCYECVDLINFTKRNMRVTEKQHTHFVVYNKHIESNGKSPYKTRIELRFTNYYGINSIKTELLNFCKMLDAMITNISKMNDTKVDALEKEFNKRKSGKHPNGKITDFKSFVDAYSSDIFNRDILKMLESRCTNYAQTKDWIRKYNNIDLITVKQITEYINTIKAAIKDFVKSRPKMATLPKNEDVKIPPQTRITSDFADISADNYFTNINSYSGPL